MMQNMLADVSLVVIATYILMLTVISILAYLSIIQIPNIREKTLLEALQSPMMMAYHDNSHLMIICFVRVLCWKILTSFAQWLKNQELTQQIFNLQKQQNIFVQNVTSMRRIGSQLQMNFGKRTERKRELQIKETTMNLNIKVFIQVIGKKMKGNEK